MFTADLNDYYYFVHVVEKGGFTRAADALGIPKSRLSRHLAQLEARLDTVLIQRTTRQIKVTQLGEVFYRHARAALDRVELAESELKRRKNALSGQVTLSCSVGVAQYALKELLARFLADNPQVAVRQQVTNQTVDLVAAGVDIAIRGHTDPLPDSSLIQRPLAVVEWRLFGSPALLSADATIDTPAALESQPSLALGWQAPGNQWQLTHRNGRKASLAIEPRLKSEDMTTLKLAASEGLGIVALPAYTCRDELASGKLINILPGWHAGQASLSLLMARRSGFTAAVEALQAYLQAEVADYVAMP